MNEVTFLSVSKFLLQIRGNEKLHKVPSVWKPGSLELPVVNAPPDHTTP
jgi:hypothetical protein